MGTPKCSRYQAASALGSRALKNTPPIPSTFSMQTPFLRASELVIPSRKRFDDDGPKAACQSANFQSHGGKQEKRCQVPLFDLFNGNADKVSGTVVWKRCQ